MKDFLPILAIICMFTVLMYWGVSAAALQHQIKMDACVAKGGDILDRNGRCLAVKEIK